MSEPTILTDRDELEAFALEHGIGAPILCDGTCDSCHCEAFAAGDWCGDCEGPASDCICQEDDGEW